MGAATAVLVSATGLGAAPGAQAAAASISINDPGALTAGPVELKGIVSAGSPQTTSVLYAIDRSQSTVSPSNNDCDGDGTPGTAGDNPNGDTSLGDTLDCEISGVIALNSSLVRSPGDLRVSAERFSTTADTADFGFVTPGDTGGGAEPRVVSYAKSLRRGNTTENPNGTDFNVAVSTALSALGGAPAGPKYVLFLSDGKGSTPVAQSTLDSLRNSGVRLRSYAIGGESTNSCKPDRALTQMAEATGEKCVVVAKPSDLSAELAGAQPASISSVQVSIAGKVFPATVDLAGGWRVGLNLGQGNYTAVATATLSSGAKTSATRAFTVAPSTSGAPTPAPGAASGTTLSPARVVANRPKPTLDKLASRVVGSVGAPGSGGGVASEPLLEGATVLLQGRKKAGAWRTVGRTTVSNGDYAVTWTPKRKIRKLRVQLLPYRSFLGSLSRVQKPGIYDCKVTQRSGSFTATCKTVAKKGTKAKLLRGKNVFLRTKVRGKHLVTVSGAGRAPRYKLSVDVSKRVHYKVRL